MRPPHDPIAADLAGRVAERLATRDLSCLPVGWTVDELTDLFVQGGIEALSHASLASEWVQLCVDATPSAASQGQLMSAISELANELLDTAVAQNFFFMQKPPGLLLRFQAAAEKAPLEERLNREVADWQTDGFVRAHWPAVYEPEHRLFGGTQSMEYVHALFTVDSLYWSAFHARKSGYGDAGAGAWSASLRMLRSVFDGLGIRGWEDLGVWDAVLDDTGRRLDLDLVGTTGYRDLTAQVRQAWAEAAPSTGKLGEEDAHLQACAEVARQQAVRWKAGYFEAPGARIGPREGAAYLTIFHWNRAGFSPVQQGLVAEALASRREQTNG